MPLLWVVWISWYLPVVSARIRQVPAGGACEGLEFMGIKLDAEKNKVRGEEMVISTEDSQVKVVVIPTDEELMIASDTMDILKK